MAKRRSSYSQGGDTHETTTIMRDLDLHVCPSQWVYIMEYGADRKLDGCVHRFWTLLAGAGHRLASAGHDYEGG
jgi:hypothetical protein